MFECLTESNIRKVRPGCRIRFNELAASEFIGMECVVVGCCIHENSTWGTKLSVTVIAPRNVGVFTKGEVFGTYTYYDGIYRLHFDVDVNCGDADSIFV